MSGLPAPARCVPRHGATVRTRPVEKKAPRGGIRWNFGWAMVEIEETENGRPPPRLAGSETAALLRRLQLEPESGRLAREGSELSLGRTAAKVLSVLLAHRQRALTQEEIRRAVWAGQVVDRGAVKGYVSDLRAILGDDPHAPRFIASVDGGYRFIATASPHSPVHRAARRASVVGRDEVLRELRDQLDRALEGRRRFAFVTGEPGIGKTTAVEVFLQEAEVLHDLLVGRGQCVEYSGPGMAYLPVLEALERICEGD